jgi:drug/metabolite transporter (DMT)-like permease
MTAHGSLAIGVAAALAVAVCNAAAISLQAVEARRAARGDRPNLRLLGDLMHRPRWLLGTGLLLLAWPLQILAMASAPLTVVQPILSTSLLMLLIIGAVRLAEPVGRREIIGVLAITAGAATVAVCGANSHIVYPAPGRVLPVMLALALGAGAACLLERLRSRWSLVVIVGAGAAYAWADFASKLVGAAASTGAWVAAVGWVLGTLCVGGLAFVSENFALQRAAATVVAPVIAAVVVVVPICFALWIGGEDRGTLPDVLIGLGALAVAAGGALVARSSAVVAVASAE